MYKLILLACCLVFFTGCGSKNLHCININTTDGVKYTTKIDTKYSESIESINLHIEMKLIDTKKTSKETFDFSTKILKSFYKDYSENGITLNEVKKNNKYILEISFDKNKLSKFSKLINTDTNSIDKFKKSLKKADYTCK